MPLVAVAAVDVLLWGVIVYETHFLYDERRYRLRHRLDVDVPGDRS